MVNRSPLFCVPFRLFPSIVAALAVALCAAGCEQPKKKPLPAADTGTSEDTATDTGGLDTGDTSGGAGDATEDTESDGSAATDTGTAATCDQQLGLLPSTDCGCGGQLICRDQAAAPVCVGALPENACGGCGGIGVEIGATCGLCGDGVWTCDPANPDLPTCVGATPQNSCGGCGTLPGVEGERCSSTGFFLCVTEDELACVGPGQNSCGGFTALGDALGGPCGECGAGRFACAGTDALRCEEAASPRNACGGCGTLPNRVGDACGDCGGTWQCDPENPEGLVCSQSRNVCGTCGSPGAGSLGASCAGGRLVCGADGQLSCESGDRNLCGGTASLDAEPGTSCGSCGGVNICAGPDRVVCVGSSPLNGCGGCGFLPGFPGTFCGVDHTWECNGDGTMSCQQTSSSVVVSNAVGGTTQVEKGQVTVPAGAVTEPIRITIRVRNGMTIPGYQLTSPVLEFGPSGTEFSTPLEVQIISDDAPASDMVWSNRPTDGGGYSEVPGAVVEGDALVGDVSHFSIGFTGIPIPDTELCGDGADNDGDGLTDCEDSDCASAMNCAPPAFELDCGNGLDDDADLLIDCADIDCINDPVCGSPDLENCSDGIDNDGNGLVDCADPVCAGPSCSPRTERCDNALDDDLDGLVDCDDSDCWADAFCAPAGSESDCANGLDDDGDGAIDCVDADCSGDPSCGSGTGEVCDDGVDNNGDTWVDCDDGRCSLACGGAAACDNTSDVNLFADPATGTIFRNCTALEGAVAQRNCLVANGFGSPCAACITDFVACGTGEACIPSFNLCSGLSLFRPEICNNRLDDNRDGLVDCADPVCSGDAFCSGSGTREVCDNGIDDDSDRSTDCADPDCIGTAACASATEVCGNGADDDGDGLVDCADIDDCVFGPIYAGCPVPVEDCANGVDDDRYGGTDCADPVCATASACLAPTERCADGTDNDGDGLVDCADRNCDASTACGADATGSCLAPYLIDGSGYYSGSMAADTNHTQGSCGGGGAVDDIWAFTPPTAGTWCIESFATADQYLYVRTDCVGGPDLDCNYGYFGSRAEFSATAGRTYFVTLDSYYGGFNYWLRVKAGSCDQQETACGDGSDNDADGAVDCADVDCGRDAACIELNCSDDLDSDNDGLVDCSDSDCASDPACFETACGDYLDNDGDTLFDCNDPDCTGAAACQEVCDDGIDNDGDNQVDCYDASCRGSVACPQQRCAGLGTYAYNAGNGIYYAGFGTPMTACGPNEGCSLISPPAPVTVSGALVPTYEGVCAPRLSDGASCTADPSDGFCLSSTSGGAGCIAGTCRREGTYCDAGQSPAWRVDFLGNSTPYCVAASAIAATNAECGDSVGAYCGRADDLCVNRTDLRVNNQSGVCVRRTSYPDGCPAGTRFSFESNVGDARSGICLPVVGADASCGVVSLCDETLNLVCGSSGTCRPAELAEGCATPSPLLANTSGIGPDLYAVDRLDGLTAADESLNCSGTVGPEKVYFYTATRPVELSIEAGSLDGNGPSISWYARKGTCGDIFAEVACSSSSLTPTRGSLQLQAGETAYLIVDSEARWAGGDGAASEFFLAVTESTLAASGESCSAAVCETGLNCGVAGLCALPACGDGVVDSGEACDDGNTSAGDGCATDCTLESYAEVEPNNSVATANLVTNARRVTGFSNYEDDLFCFPLAAGGGRLTIRPVADIVVDGSWLYAGQSRIKSFTASQGCFAVYGNNIGYQVDVGVEPFEALPPGAACGPVLVTGAYCADISGAPAVCRETSPRLHRGSCETTSCGDGFLDGDRGETCDDGNTVGGDGCSAACLLETYTEVEPNNGTLTARNLGGYRVVSGTIATTSDYDYFKVTLAKRSHLEFDLESTAFGNGTNSLGLQLLSSTSAVLFSGTMDAYYGQSGARGGYQPANAGYIIRQQALAFLEPGTYTVRLSASGTTTGAYTLYVRDIPTSVVAAGGACDPASYKPCADGLACSVIQEVCTAPVCGDGDVTVGEACDDGNLVAGDGCNADCVIEGYPADSISSSSGSVTRIDGGAEYTFADGSSARAVGIVGPWTGSYNRYLYLHFDAPTRVRALNASRGYSRFRIWKYGMPSTYSSEGTQVIGIDGSYPSYPAWFAATTPAPADAVTCDGAGGDGVCANFGDGSDCVDCGARYASTPPTSYGYDTRLAPGDYILELRPYDGATPLWLLLGESPTERAAHR